MRQRWAGKMCLNCHRLLPPPHTSGEKWCDVCRPTHRVLMDFEYRAGAWRVTYRDMGRWPFPRTSTFLDPDKLRLMYDRFAVNRMSEDRNACQYGLSTGRGLVELSLTPEQYAVLKEEKESPM